MIPDELYDWVSLHAIKTKVKVRDKKGREYLRSPNVSEMVCMAIESYRAKIASDEKGRAPAGD